ncbi:uncharacterized protein LOC144097392 [Amblyomma americanum]
MASGQEAKLSREKVQEEERKASSSSTAVKKKKPRRRPSSSARSRRNKERRRSQDGDATEAPRDDQPPAGAWPTASEARSVSPAAGAQGKPQSPAITTVGDTDPPRDDHRGTVLAPPTSTAKSSSPNARAEKEQRHGSQDLGCRETARDYQPPGSAAPNLDEKPSPGAQLCCTHPVSVPQGGEKSFGTVEPLVREESRGSRMKWRSPAPPHRSSKLSAPFARKTAREAPSTTKGPISVTAHVAERSELWRATTELGNQLSDGRKSSVRFGSTTQLEITPRSSTSQKSEGLRRVFTVVCVTTAVAATGVLLMWAMWPYANTVMKYCDSAESKLASEGEPRRRQK